MVVEAIMTFDELYTLLISSSLHPHTTLGPFVPESFSRLLLQSEIETLIHVAVSKKPLIYLAHTKKTIPLMTLLASMGTTTSVHDDKPGMVDARIEHAMIQAAIKKNNATPLDAPRYAIFGLSGNPTHLAHLREMAHHAALFPVLYLVLNQSSPLKPREDYADADIRLALLTRALQDELSPALQEKIRIETLELDRKPPSRMITTLSQLMLMSEDTMRLTLIVGADTLVSFHQWHRYADFGALCDLKVVVRPGFVLTDADLQQACVRFIANNMRVTFTYETDMQKNQYLRIITNLEHHNLLQLSHEPSTGLNCASSEIRKHYQTGHTEAHPHLHPSSHALIVETESYGYTRDLPKC